MFRPTVIFGALCLAGAANARLYSPRIVSPHVADAYSMKSFAEHPRWRDLSGDALAYEVYSYLADTETGLFHMNEVLEGHDALAEYNTVRDPVKIINVYGYGYCGIFGPVMAGIAEQIGLGPARTVVLPGWNHVVAEASYDGGWHYLDVDVRAVFRRPDGTLASMDEAKRDASLWEGPRGPLFFPNDPLDNTRKVYEETPVLHFYGYHQSGHTMDFVLRQGETLTRWWKPRGGRWNHSERYNKAEWLTKLIEQPPRGPKPNHRHFTVHNHGNGRFVYAPNLTDGSTDFADGIYDSDNVAPSPEGLRLIEPGEGSATFEVQSPYIIVPVVGDASTTGDDREASVVEMDADGVSLSISLDNGLTWQPVAAGSPDAPIDLTQHVSGTYGYLLKLTLRGRPAVAVVRSLKITTWTQVAPASLPALRQGANRMAVRVGDDYGLPTRLMDVRTNAGDPDELLKHLYEPPADYDPGRKTSRVRGPMVLRVQAPPRAKIAWLTVMASFQTHQREHAIDTRNEMAYAVGEPADFKTIYQSKVPTDQQHWHRNVAREVKLEKPARAVYVRLVGDPGANNVRVYAHCLDDEPKTASPLVVTHVWREADQRRSKRVELAAPGDYEIVAGDAPANDSIEIAVPSDGPSSTAPGPQASRPLPPDAPGWVGPMRTVHARFTGERGSFAQFGDSITESRAFWFGLQWSRKNAPPEMQEAFELVNGYMLKGCWDGKGADNGNLGRMTVRWAHQNIDTWLSDLDPEVAVVMFGTNDLNDLGLEEYETKMRELLRKCLDNGTVVILSTIPPRHGFEEKAAATAGVIREIARELRVPLTDFHAEILRRRPNDWDGALDTFAGFEGYDVPTLIARDGVHPSNPKRHSGDYSEEALRTNGFSLRNYLALVKYAEVIRHVMQD